MSNYYAGEVNIYNGSGEFQRQIINRNDMDNAWFKSSSTSLNDDGSLIVIKSEKTFGVDGNPSRLDVYNTIDDTVKFGIDPFIYNGKIESYNICGTDDDGYLVFSMSPHTAEPSGSGSGSGGGNEPLPGLDVYTIFVYSISTGSLLTSFPSTVSNKSDSISISGTESSGATIVAGYFTAHDFSGTFSITCMSPEGVVSGGSGSGGH